MTREHRKNDKDDKRGIVRLPAKQTLMLRAQEAIEFLMDRGGFFPYSKNQFALVMGERFGRAWLMMDDGPDRRLVEDVCNLTRDQFQDPMVELVLGGYVVSYSPSQGGMTLVDPTGEQPLDHLVHMLTGDLQRDQAIRTQLRRRLPTWKTAGANAAKNDDNELARLCWQIESEIDGTGHVSETLQAQWFQMMRVRGLFEDA